MTIFDLVPPCPACGAIVGDPETHAIWHDGISEITRLVVAPGVPKADWMLAARQAAEMRQALREAEEAARAPEPDTPMGA
jgi:hypothetical protein